MAIFFDADANTNLQTAEQVEVRPVEAPDLPDNVVIGLDEDGMAMIAVKVGGTIIKVGGMGGMTLPGGWGRLNASNTGCINLICW